jgi:cobalt/nickel transport system ATP-binding protein
LSTQTFPLFKLADISYAYIPEHPVLSNISLQVYCGQSLVILGANGSGKSTLLKILAGLVHPTSGQVFAFGQEVSEKKLQDQAFLSEFRQRVGFIFQNSDSQLFSATVRDELAFAPLQQGLPAEQCERRIIETADLLGITHLLDRSPYKLSGGEKKKISLACVLTANPEVLFLDEPTNGLDPRTQFWLVEFISALQKSGKTIVTATHDLSIVEEIAQRVIILRENHTIAADDTPLKTLSDRKLLLEVNLIHERSHFHLGGTIEHC